MKIFNKILSILLCSSCLIASAQANNHVEKLKISRPGDIELSCGALSEEATLMRDIIFTTQDMQNNAKMKSRGAAVAGTAASFLIGTVTGGIGLAAAGFLIDENISTSADKTNKIQDTAEQRRSFIMGIHNAKGCYGPLDHALQNPEDLKSLSEFAEAATLQNIEPAAGDRSPPNRYNE